MRCKYGATTKCKVLRWTDILEYLRQIVLELGLQEEIKWGVPVYTSNGKNIISISALKDAAILGFFKGALLKDNFRILEQQGNIQAARIIRFTTLEGLIRQEEQIKVYILEAQEVELKGIKLEKGPQILSRPLELDVAFKSDSSFEKAFVSLTPGRQRAYLIQFSQPKQTQTRVKRIEKYKPQIMAGLGLHDSF